MKEREEKQWRVQQQRGVGRMKEATTTTRETSRKMKPRKKLTNSFSNCATARQSESISNSAGEMSHFISNVNLKQPHRTPKSNSRGMNRQPLVSE